MAEEPYFVMPSSALLALREELQISEGVEMSREALYRYGMRCGEALVRNLGVTTPIADFSGIFQSLWFEIGLGRPSVDQVSEEEIVVSFSESIEVSPNNSCDFTRGYLAGVTSSLLGVKYSCIETTCVSDGAPCCTHILKPTSLGVSAPPAVAEKEKPKYALNQGVSYLIKEDHPDVSYKVAEDALVHGWRVLCITREFPETIREKYALRDAAFFWLTLDESKEYAFPPTDLARIYSYVRSFLGEEGKAFVLFTGVEYLISQNNYNQVLKFIQLINDKVAIQRGVLTVSVSPLALEEKELKTLERETSKAPFEQEVGEFFGGK
jgi:predicted hydrocarbon binding protein